MNEPTPQPSPEEAPPSKVELTDLEGQSWLAAFRGERLELSGPDGASASVTRGGGDDELRLLHGLSMRPLLEVRTSDQRFAFRLTDEQFRAVGTWLGRAETARRAVSGFALVAIICGVLFILTALPPAMLGIDDATALESPRGLDALGMLLGGLALSAGLAARFRPSRFALVANAAWCIGAAIDTGSKVTTGESSPVWLAGAAMLLALAWGQIRIYFLVGELPKESLPDV